MARDGSMNSMMQRPKLTARANIRVTVEELAELREAAETADKSLSEYVRTRAVGRPVIASADMAIVRELRRLGGLLKHMHVESRGSYAADTAAAIQAIRRYIEGLGAS